MSLMALNSISLGMLDGMRPWHLASRIDSDQPRIALHTFSLRTFGKLLGSFTTTVTGQYRLRDLANSPADRRGLHGEINLCASIEWAVAGDLLDGVYDPDYVSKE